MLGPCCNAEHSEKHRFKKLSRRLLISLRNATTEIFQMGGLSVVSRSGKVVGSGVPSPSLPDAKLATLTSDCTALESQNGVDAALAPRDQWSYLIEFDECNGSNNKAQRYGMFNSLDAQFCVVQKSRTLMSVFVVFLVTSSAVSFEGWKTDVVLLCVCRGTL